MLVSLGWVGWVAWQIAPRSLVTEEGLKAGATARQAVDLSQAALQAATAAPDSTPEPLARQPSAIDGASSSLQPETGVSVSPSLRLAAAIETPIGEPVAGRARGEDSRVPRPSRGSQGAEAPKATTRPANDSMALKLDVPPARVLSPLERTPVRLERRERESSPAERAEREFRRALALLRDGRPGEAGEVLATVLSLDRSHAAARQTLVALALERGQLDEAAKLLEDGLAIHPDNLAFAVALARIHVERRNPAGALAVLEPHRRDLLLHPQHAQFLAAVEQRLGRHAEAAEALRAALAANPQSGPGWVALGVSLEALGRPAEAAESYRRALAVGGLAAAAQEYAEARIRALR
ncbi:MAG: tetratricopeptide repeat protein [Burkholderiales bacterium]|nr:tetratricopeptide repeat protein [Burkholderiales bacterium]